MAIPLEEQAFDLLREKLNRFYVPNLAERKQVLSWLGISSKFVRSFDGLQLGVENFKDITGPLDFDLIEVKATQKFLPLLDSSPTGFFFGMTENEEMLLKIFGKKAHLCLVSVNPESRGYFLTDWERFQTLNMNKRIQYQINMK